MRENLTLACTECKQRNYETEKNKRNNPDRLEKGNSVNFVDNIQFTKKQNSFLINHRVGLSYRKRMYLA